VPEEEIHRTEHTITVAAPAGALYDLIADVTRWPAVFGPTVHAERVEGGGPTERIRLWALANDEVKTWVSRRNLDRDAYRVEFRQEVSQPPVGSMGGEWVMRPRSDDETVVVLTHDYTAIDDDPAKVDWIARAVDRNSRSELAALKAAVERRPGLGELMFSFADSVTIGGPAPEVYDYIYQCALWPRRLPHVSRLVLDESVPGIQRMAMDTRSADGETHTTESVRLCFPTGEIVYKQTTVPKLLTAHTGRWTFEEVAEGTRATSEHTVVINPDAVPDILGAGATVADARAAVRKALGTNSTATLLRAKDHVETVRERTA
jgi:ribosome-associated toxin RatA of RatAB toxin-antitoxin module